MHVVWYDFRDVNFEIYYKRSTDAGVSWGADTRLTNNTGYSLYPSVTATGSVVHVVWKDERDGNWEIYYKRSIDEGVTWGADTRLTNNSATSELPSVSVSGSAVHVVWYDGRDEHGVIYYKRSTDGGISWGADTRLSDSSVSAGMASLTVSGSVVHVVWNDYRHDPVGFPEIFYKRSTDGGISWGTDTRLTNNPAFSFFPSVSVSGSFVNVVWYDSRDGNSEIYYKRSTDGGISWEADTRLTNNTADSWLPSVSVSGSVVHAIWMDKREGHDEIYYKRSTDEGMNWCTDTRLTNNSVESSRPSLTVSGSVVHVIRYDKRDGNFEIYYKRDPTGNPIGIQPISNEIPNGFSLLQNYPNPFNPSTIIRFNIKDPGFTTLKVFDILGREAASLVNEQLKAGTYEVEWPAPTGNASNYPSGVYYYRIAIHSDKLPAEDFVETKKMVMIK